MKDSKNIILYLFNFNQHFFLVFQDIKQVMTFPIVPDLRRNKARDMEGPVLEKAMPVYQLLQREIVMKELKDRTDQLIVSH